MSKITKRLIYAFGVLCILYFSVGFFVIQPIGAIPEGVTILYLRLGLNSSFITSADGILIDNNQDVSLFSRMIVMGGFATVVKERKLIALPYSRTMYLISTGGREFEK